VGLRRFLIKRELCEECGLSEKDVTFLHADEPQYTDPGLTNERLQIFYFEVQKQGESFPSVIHGGIDETEEIETLWLNKNEFDAKRIDFALIPRLILEKEFANLTLSKKG